MIKIYILNVQDLQKQGFSELVSSLPFGDGERQRLCAIGNSKHRWESLGGLVALWRLCEDMGVDLPLEIQRTPSGKPYFADKRELGFGISHSSGFAAAAIDTAGHAELGFDVETVDESYDFSGIAGRFFTEDEQIALQKGGSTPECFFRLWTKKEARAKADGRGLSALLKGDADGDLKLWQRTVSVADKRICVALCRKNQIRSVKIYTDGKESYELQN